jgi:hypothetical protein
VRIAALLLLAALALTGCETTAEKSAKLEKQAKRVTLVKQKGLSITRQSTVIKVLETGVVHDTEGAAAVVSLRNTGPRALSDVPIAIAIRSADGASVYTNSTPGLSRTLVSVALVPAHAELTWIDDQIQTASADSASARVGEGPAVSGALPKISLAGVHPHEEAANGTTAEGTVTNHSSVAQQELVIYAVARRGRTVVAAGRAVLASLPAGATAPFQIFFIGEPRGARLQLSVPPTTLG